MTKWLLITLIVLVGIQTPARAQDFSAPVEVHMDTGEALYMYDCWPLTNTTEGIPEEPPMLVYVKYAGDLIIGYACIYNEGAWFPPVEQYGPKYAKNVY